MKNFLNLIIRFYSLSLHYTNFLRVGRLMRGVIYGSWVLVLSFASRIWLQAKARVTRGSIFFKLIGLVIFIYLVYKFSSVKVLTKIIIGVVICVLTFVSERYIFTKIHNDNLVIQSIKRGFIYLFIIIIFIFTDIEFGLNIFDSIIYCDSTDGDSNNNQQSQSNSSTQATPTTSSTQQSESTMVTVLNSAKETSSNLAKFGDNYIPYGVGGSLGAATIKYSGGAPMNQRVMASTAAAGLGVLASGIAGIMVKGINNNRVENELKRKNEQKKLEESDRTGGSGNFGGDSNFTANSPLDSGEMINPLLDILDNLILFYMIEFILILVIIYFILNKILKNKIGLILVKYVPSKYKKIHNIISKVNDTSGRIDSIFVLIFFIYIITN